MMDGKGQARKGNAVFGTMSGLLERIVHITCERSPVYNNSQLASWCSGLRERFCSQVAGLGNWPLFDAVHAALPW